MPNVNNWQLGRDMSYPHEERHPRMAIRLRFQSQPLHRLSDVHDGLQEHLDLFQRAGTRVVEQCREQTVRRLPTKLGRQIADRCSTKANPDGQVWDTGQRDAEQRPYGTFEGMTIFEAAQKKPRPDGPQQALGYLPTDDEWRYPNMHEDTAAGGNFNKNSQYGGSVELPEHKVWFFHLARICNHCTYPGCLGSCPRNAIYKRPEDGIVLIDQSRCRGYRKCVEGCPYKKAIYRPTSRTSEKCIGCFPRVEGQDKDVSPTGAPAETRCMSACVGKIRLQGLVQYRRRWQLGRRPKQPPVFSDSRASACLAPLSAIRNRATWLLHSATLGPSKLL